MRQQSNLREVRCFYLCIFRIFICSFFCNVTFLIGKGNSRILSTSNILEFPLPIKNVTLQNKPNILLILADDLGYGDTSLSPFVISKGHNWPCDEGGILTPELEKMATKGIILTNFHSAAPVCSPARAAIMTGLYSYRLNALNAFELGRDLSQRNGFLPQVPTMPEIFREAGYYTGHSGKWHLGGMREEYRKARLSGDCSRPGPLQHGFQEYLSMLDGPQSPRYTFLNRDSILHSEGHNYLIKNDLILPNNHTKDTLSDVEAQGAIRMMRENAEKRPGQPWFIQLWFNAPHGPWEVLPSGQKVYETYYNKPASYFNKLTCPQNSKEPITDNKTWRYKTMITAMDKSIGRVLQTLRDLNIEDNTLVVFTSDNGMERGAGTAGVYMEGKRSLMEGGIRVPTVIQWPGTIPANESINLWGAHTDLLPTFLEAAGIPRPANLRIDGLSILPVLKQKKRVSGKPRRAPHEMAKRMYLWHRDTDPYDGRDGRINSAGLFEHIKIITRETPGYLYKVFDLKADPTERRNLLRSNGINFDNFAHANIESMIASDASQLRCADGNSTHCALKYNERNVWKIKQIMAKLSKFVAYGNHGWERYMAHRQANAICKVPKASEIAMLHYGDANCTRCSYPEY